MIKNKVLSEIYDYSKDSLELCIKAEEQDSDFTLVREIIEQLMDELEALEE